VALAAQAWMEATSELKRRESAAANGPHFVRRMATALLVFDVMLLRQRLTWNGQIGSAADHRDPPYPQKLPPRGRIDHPARWPVARQWITYRRGPFDPSGTSTRRRK
jgi:hypothetical protein